MHELRENARVTFLFIEHDMEVVMNHSDEVVVMAQGETIVKGLPEDVRGDQRVIDAYLGGGGGRDEPGPEARRGRGEDCRTPADGRRRTPRVSEVLLKTEGVVAGYTPEVDILNGVDMEVREGEIVTIVGPNGAGKSTLMKAIFGLLTPREGTVIAGRRGRSPATPRTRSPARASPTSPSSTTSSPASPCARTSSSARSPAAAAPSTSASSACTSSSRGSRSVAARPPARCRAASGRWSRWRGR